ncbi:M24 family metallopeptidase [Mycobacterium xenopi]|uniref:Peptidase n=1 Tax=Mycobacterium xenopi TaxID=1789 RepID=A0AAD1M0Q4_MYCXE|nr:Xaa-Pro peptidase family protein [Mycobacterium xenopi]MDA3641161.1 Xaa-Pro peptidase family protein [Mycobacterium xenopi]MDA3658961.1 Xaa-Pro peptidase family protein [Mycobacterium xenopi]MDA3663006.1 Xaa-Pro peptidase family protein [Mycobacterium xenopi]ORX19615.1 peptidase [Mycobacterium xenopi]SPX78136.1 Xaa-Pro aminopeptidase [Mycobacterium xenopi]
MGSGSDSTGRPAEATIGGRAIPDQPDLARMRAQRWQRLQHELTARDLDGVVLLGSSSVTYATGAALPAEDGDRAALFRAVAVAVTGDAAPHLYTCYDDGVPADLPDDHLHGPLFPDLDDGVDQLAEALGEHFGFGARIGIDHQTHAMRRGVHGFDWVDAADVIATAKVVKTPDEVACIRYAQHLNELAMVDALRILRPGVRQIDLSATFLRRAFELGASAGGIDPIWQVMAPTRECGPWTLHGDLAYPTVTTDRFLRDGDVIWVDAGITWHGYASDYGRTWVVGAKPSDRQHNQFRRWRVVVDSVLDLLKPGVSALQLCNAAAEANDGVRPWIKHFYLAHGVGTESAEMPLIGTDFGEQFDEQLTMQPGMVVVLEPVIWDDGAAGYRAEDIVAVTDTGWIKLSDSVYDPYGLGA